MFTFSPNPATIVIGDTVRWTWAGSNHTLTSGSNCVTDSGYCSRNDTNCPAAPAYNANTTYSHTFTQAGTFPYFCRVHCGFSMTGTVNVVSPFITVVSVVRDGNGFSITGQTAPDTTLTVQSSPDLMTGVREPSSSYRNAHWSFYLHR
jgi:plastocyanin